uniref:Beta-glucosidase n=1 Tax=Dunaliella tertiolecta TaxID=3047 RepID=A0A7S3VJH2_DUNTE
MPGKKQEEGNGLADRFLKGVGIATWQNAADDGLSNWSRFAYQRWPFSKLGISTTRGKHKVGKSCNFWERYKEDLKLTKDLGSTSFRFSFEWARIEPTRGHYDAAAIQRFHDILDTMEELGLEPNVTLHHFTHPTWFEDLGGFRKEENIPLFVEWAQFMFRTFHKRIKLWATFNEPTCYSFLAYIVGMAPPGHIFNLIGSGQTMLNILKAHTATYKALKAMPGGQEAQIGLVNHHITFTAAGEGRLHKVASWMAEWLTYWWGWDIVDHWMHTGEFEWKLPVVGTWITWKDPEGKPPCDWWGINFYSRCVLSWYLQPACFPNDVMTDMYYPIYPEGLYNCIKRSSQYGIPMYITETGIADCRDDRCVECWKA